VAEETAADRKAVAPWEGEGAERKAVAPWEGEGAEVEGPAAEKAVTKGAEG